MVSLEAHVENLPAKVVRTLTPSHAGYDPKRLFLDSKTETPKGMAGESIIYEGHIIQIGTKGTEDRIYVTLSSSETNHLPEVEAISSVLEHPGSYSHSDRQSKAIYEKTLSVGKVTEHEGDITIEYIVKGKLKPDNLFGSFWYFFKPILTEIPQKKSPSSE